jgi:hypothetical protein
MYSKKLLLASVCALLIAGLLIGIVFFQDNIFPSTPSTANEIQADVVHAYIKVYDVNPDSGLGYGKLASYVVVLNITNPTDIKWRLSGLTMSIAENGSKDGTSVALSSILNSQRDFSDSNTEYYWYPHTSKLVAFSQTGFMPERGLEVLNRKSILLYADVSGAVVDGKGGGSAIIFEYLPMNNLGNEEFVYGSTFGPDNYFFFDDYSIDLSFGNGRIV